MRDALQQIFEEYVAFLERAQGLSPSCLWLHRRHIPAFLADLRRHGLTRWRDLSPRHVDRFVRRYAPKFRRPYRANVLYTLRRFLKYLHFRGLLDRPLHELVLMVRMFRYERLPRFLTQDQLRKLLDSVDRSSAAGRRDYAAILLLASTGLRAGELLGLTLDDVDWRERRVRVTATKTRTSRVVPVPGPAFDALVEYLRRDRPAGASHRRLFVCYGPSYGWRRDPPALSYNTLGRVLRGYLRRVGLAPRSSCHALRHTYAQHLLEQGIGYPALQSLLGHRSLHTVGFYARVNFAQLREVTDNYAEEL